MQIALFRNDKHVVGLDEEPFGDQFDRHPRIAREDFVQLGCDGPEVVNDNDSSTHVSRQMPQ